MGNVVVKVTNIEQKPKRKKNKENIKARKTETGEEL